MIKTINLEASVEWVKSKLRDLLDDPTDLLEQFDGITAAASRSASEGLAAGHAAARASCCRQCRADFDAECAEKLGRVVNKFLNDLRVWHYGEISNETSQLGDDDHVD